MGVMELRFALTNLAKIYRASGAVSQAADVEKLAGLVDENRHESVVSVADEIASAANPTQALIGDLLNELNSIGTDRAAFDPILTRLKTNRNFDKVAVEQIASKYIGVERTWKSKKAAIDEIESTFVSRAYQANKMKIVEQYKGW